MVLNLKDKEENLSGKGFNWSIFGLLDGEKESKNAEVFRRIAEDMKHARDASEVLAKEYGNLTSAGKKMADEMLASEKNTKKLSQGFLAAATSAEKATFASRAAAFGMKALDVAINMGITLAISFAINGLIKLAQSFQASIDKANELTQAWKDQQHTIQNNISTLEDLKTEFSELAKGVDENGKNVSLSADQYKRYQSIVRQIADISPSVVQGYTAEGQALVDNNTVIEEAIRLQERLNEQKRQEYLADSASIVKGARNEMISQQRDMLAIREKINKSFYEHSNSLGFGKVKDEFENAFSDIEGLKIQDYITLDTDSILTYSDAIIDKIKQYNLLSDDETEKLKEQIGLLKVKNNEYDASVSKIAELLTTYAQSDSESDWHDKIQTGYLDEFYNSLNDIAANGTLSAAEMKAATRELGESFLKIQDQIPTKEIDDLKQSFRSGIIDADEFNKGIQAQVGIIRNLAEKYPDLAYVLNSIADSFNSYTDNAIKASQALTPTAIIDPSIQSFSDLNAQLDSIQSAYKTFTSAIEEYNQTGTLSLDTTQAIMSLGDEYIGLLFDENGQLQLNRESFIALANAKLDELEATALRNAMNNIDALTDEATAAQYLKDKTKEATEATSENTLETLKNYAAHNLDSEGKLAEATQLIIDTFAQYKTVIDSTRAGLGQYTSATLGAASATKELADAQKELEDQVRADGEAAIRVIDRHIKSIQDDQKASEKAIDAKIKKIKKEKEAFEESIDAEIKKLNERKKALEDSIEDYESAAGSVVDLIGEQMDAIEERRDEVNAFYDEQLDALDKTNEALQEQIDREEALEALQKAKSQRLIIYRKGQGFVDAENEGAVKDAQDNYDQILADQALQAEKDRLEGEREEKLASLDDEKKQWEDYQQLWEDSTTTYEREQQRLISLKILGKDWEQAILAQRLDIVNRFKEEHYNQTQVLQENVLVQIETLTLQKEEELAIFDELIAAQEEKKEREAANYAASIEDLNVYKEQVQEQLNLIGVTWEEYNEQLELEAKWEAKLFDGMAAEVEAYADRVEAAMRRANASKPGGSSSSSKSTSSGSSSTSVADKSSTTSSATQSSSTKSGSSINSSSKKSSSSSNRKGRTNKNSSPTSKIKPKHLATGGVVTDPGLFITDEDGKETKIRVKNGKATLLEKGDLVLPHGTSLSQLMMLAARTMGIATPNLPSLMSPTPVATNYIDSHDVKQTIHIDKIELPNIKNENDAGKLVQVLLDMGRESYHLPD